MATQKIPSAEEIYQEEAFVILQEGTYDFQLKRILEELKNLNKDNGTVSVSFKAIPDVKILDELISQGYTVKFDTFYDSTKTEKYLTKLRITNPKFSSKCNFLENLEDQMKGFSFSTGNFNLPEGAENFLRTFAVPHKQ